MSREMQDIFDSGEVTDLKVNGTAADDSVAKIEDLDTHEADLANPHQVTKTQVGLPDADDTSDADKPVSDLTQIELDLKADAADLTNVDNTSDASKPVSIATQAELDTKVGTTGVVTVGFDPQDPAPARVEGLVFYDAVSKSHSVYNDTDMTLNLGQEEIIRVWNATGVTIPNATPVYQAGIVNGLPSVAPAKADMLSTAVVPGVTTQEILDGTPGFITHAGRLGGDFSGFQIGAVLFLSEANAGGYVDQNIPDYATRIGTVLDNAVDGAMLVRIASLTSVPTVLAYMNEALDPPSGIIPATWQDITDFQDHGNVGMVYDPVLGTITLPVDGTYRVSFNLSMTFTSSASARIFSLQLWNVTAGASVFTIPTSITKDVANYDSTISAPFTGLQNNVYVFRVTCPAALAAVSFNFTSFDIQSMHIRSTGGL